MDDRLEAFDSRPRTIIPTGPLLPPAPPLGYRRDNNRSAHNQSGSLSKTSSSQHLQPQELDTQKLMGRIRYLQSILGAFREFQSSKNIAIIKQFVASNNKNFKDLIDQLYDLKERNQKSSVHLNTESGLISVGSSGTNTPAKNLQPHSSIKGSSMPSATIQQLQRLRRLNQQLKREYTLEKQKEEALLANRSAQQEQAADEQVRALQETLKSLQEEADSLSRQNSRYVQVLSKKNFFKEYEFMCKQCQGTQKQNEKLKEHLKRRREELAKLKPLRQ